MAVINTVDNGVIIPNLRADIMRKSMQPKGLLQHKGGIYVGTGQYEDIQAGTDTYRIYKTTEVFPADDTPEGTPLVTDTSVDGGVKYGLINGASIENASIPLSKFYTQSQDQKKILYSNNGTLSFESLPTVIPDGTLPITKLESGLCNESVVSSSDQALSIQLKQNNITKEIFIQTVAINYPKLIDKMTETVKLLPDTSMHFVIEDGILTIQQGA